MLIHRRSAKCCDPAGWRVGNVRCSYNAFRATCCNTLWGITSVNAPLTLKGSELVEIAISDGTTTPQGSQPVFLLIFLGAQCVGELG